jgi:hypothetical protein
MGLDAGIWGQFAPRVKSVADFTADRQHAQANALAMESNQMAMDERRNALADDNALKVAMRDTGGDPTKIRAALVGGGHIKPLMAYDTHRAGITEKEEAAKKHKLESEGLVLKNKASGYDMASRVLASANPLDPQSVVGAYAQVVQSGFLTQEQAQDYLAEYEKLPPAEQLKWYSKQLRMGLDAKERAAAEHNDFVRVETNRHNVAGETHNRAVLGENTRHHRQTEGVAWANHGETKRHHGVTETNAATARTDTLTKPFEVTAPDGVTKILVQQDRAGNIRPVQGYLPKGAAAGEPKMTEDQGKATGWLVQAENAYKNMMAAGLGADGKPTSAAYPGFNDALSAIPSLGATTAIANTMRGAGRQKFMQASESLSEALLRAATGAGVNKEEAAQKVRELTPVFGEDEETTKQKFAAIPLYIQSLKVRAGPGARRAEGIQQGGGGSVSANFGSDPADPLGLRK